VKTRILMASGTCLKAVYTLWRSLAFDMGLCFNSVQTFEQNHLSNGVLMG